MRKRVSSVVWPSKATYKWYTDAGGSKLLTEQLAAWLLPDNGVELTYELLTGVAKRLGTLTASGPSYIATLSDCVCLWRLVLNIGRCCQEYAPEEFAASELSKDVDRLLRFFPLKHDQRIADSFGGGIIFCAFTMTGPIPQGVLVRTCRMIEFILTTLEW